MGALSGSLSYTRFFVEGELPHDHRNIFAEAVQHRAFEPLTSESDDEERVGWCSIEHPLDTEFDVDKLFYNEYLNVALRMDKWRLPGALLKAYCTEAERAYMHKHGKTKLRRGEKDDIKAVVTADLKARLLPSMKTIDVSWNTHTGVVRFWNQSGKTCEQFQEFFEETFRLRLVAENPYVSAILYDLDDDQGLRLAELEPSIFHEDEESLTSASASKEG